MRVVVLTNPQSNQNALVSKLAERVDVAAVVLSRNIPRKKPTFGHRLHSSVNAIASRTFGRELLAGWNEILRRYEKAYPRVSASRIVHVENVNDEATGKAISDQRPDLVVVSGTNIVGRKLIEHSEAFGGIVNLHTGISPYVKGGPNCTNWCLAKEWFHLIGNTVMWLDAGVDSGKIIATERTPLDGSETLAELHWKVMEHAHDLYINAITQIGEGNDLPGMPQSEIAEGSEFRSIEWNAWEMKRALTNFKGKYRRYFETSVQPRDVRLYALNRG